MPNWSMLNHFQPGVLLIVEVGYKFKFFGEDAKIAAKELNVGKLLARSARFAERAKSLMLYSLFHVAKLFHGNDTCPSASCAYQETNQPRLQSRCS